MSFFQTVGIALMIVAITGVSALGGRVTVPLFWITFFAGVAFILDLFTKYEKEAKG